MSSTRTRGGKSTPHPDLDDPPRRRANKQPWHGTYENDRPPIIHIISRETGEERCPLVGHSDKATCWHPGRSGSDGWDDRLFGRGVELPRDRAAACNRQSLSARVGT